MLHFIYYYIKAVRKRHRIRKQYKDNVIGVTFKYSLLGGIGDGNPTL